MKYTVVWKSSAIADLAKIWAAALDRSAVTSASDAIDEKLRFDPVLRGETYRERVRVMIAEPLIITYRVNEGDRIVRVLTVERLPSDNSQN
jgi:2-methylcitrate dehydratase PrpD